MPLFTKTQWEIIRHRLEVGDAIAEVLEDDYGISPSATKAAVNHVELIGDSADYWDRFTSLEQKVIIDCVEGSTFFADIDEAKPRAAYLRKSYLGLADKLRELTGKDIIISDS